MTSTEMRPLRRATRIATAATTMSIFLGGVILAAPAQANVPDGWSNPADVDPLHAIGWLVGGPVILIVLIALAVYLPALARGEKLSGGAADRDPEWFGGPRKGNAELAAPDTEASQAGGASGKW